jgi:hypothetical protein
MRKLIFVNCVHFNISNCIFIIYVSFHIQEDQDSIPNLETVFGIASFAILFGSLTNFKINFVLSLNTRVNMFYAL